MPHRRRHRLPVMNTAKRHYVILAAPGVGLLHGTECRDIAQAKTLLFDRVANEDAFPGEFVARVPIRVAPPGHPRRIVAGPWLAPGVRS